MAGAATCPLTTNGRIEATEVDVATFETREPVLELVYDANTRYSHRMRHVREPLAELVAYLREHPVAGPMPKRTLVYTAWDGEEPALLGSTEWVEAHMDDLQKHAVAYINSDGNGRGFLNMSGCCVRFRFAITLDALRTRR